LTNSNPNLRGREPTNLRRREPPNLLGREPPNLRGREPVVQKPAVRGNVPSR
jgi:hypothetical protein